MMITTYNAKNKGTPKDTEPVSIQGAKRDSSPATSEGLSKAEGGRSLPASL